jgi:hypothetical protein
METTFYRYLSAGVVFASCTILSSCAGLNHPTGTIEQKYAATGVWAVTTSPGGACCDSLGNAFDLYYPTNLGANGFKHPILTWGNGTNGAPGNYATFLRHMASWGFVVIATVDKMTGAGQTILDGANVLIAANGNAASIFFSKLNTAEIGAFGHSQGAAGAMNALIKSSGTIKTTLPIELPARIWCVANCVPMPSFTQGSVFFLDGSLDPISPPTQSAQTSGEQSIAGYYNAVPAGVAKLKGTLKGPTHNDVTGQPDCAAAQPPCLIGVFGYLGYPTAWMMYQLQADAFAHGAFVSGTGEMFSQTVNWEQVESNIP